MELKPLHNPEEGPLRVGVLFSGGASGGRYLLENDSNLYKVVGGITDNREAEGIERLKEFGVKVEVIEKEDSSPSDRGVKARKDYFSELTAGLKKYDPDVVVLSGFMQILKDPLLKEFHPRIINVHPADLTIEENGKRKYTGDDSVHDAVISGEDYVRSSVHVVTKDIDEGPLLALSGKFPVERGLVSTLRKKAPDLIRKYSDVLQEWMKWKGDGPCLAAALDLIGKGRVGSRGEEILLEKKEKPVKGHLDLEEEKIITETG